jgi:hypothetical protein
MKRIDIDSDDESPMARICRVVNVVEALPHGMPDDTPLREVLPGGWPTFGDLRKIAEDQFGREGGKKSAKWRK